MYIEIRNHYDNEFAEAAGTVSTDYPVMLVLFEEIAGGEFFVSNIVAAKDIADGVEALEVDTTVELRDLREGA